MRIKRVQNDFRVFEILDESLLGKGSFQVYRATKRGLTTPEAIAVLAREAGVEPAAVSFAGLKDKDGITGQFLAVEGGRKVDFKDHQLTLRTIGKSPRGLETTDSDGNSFEIVVRDLTGDDMRRIRINLAQVKAHGLPNYFDDQRFGCLRHGQGFIVKNLLKGKYENALKSLLAAPSPYGSDVIEGFKAGIQRRWGDWKALAEFCRGRRGSSAFRRLVEDPTDFAGALHVGVSSRERTMHLFAYQSHLWNRAAGLAVKAACGDDVWWLPGDAGSVPVWEELGPEAREKLAALEIPILGVGEALGPEASRLYDAVLRSERISQEEFLALDLPGFRPKSEPRSLLMEPLYLRAAPAERDEMHRNSQKMRLRFTLPRGHYATLVCKRLAKPDDPEAPVPRFFVSRHLMPWPDKKGDIQRPPRKKYASSYRDRDDSPPRSKDGRPPRRQFDGPPRRKFDGPPRRKFDGPPRRKFDGPPRGKPGGPKFKKSHGKPGPPRNPRR